MFSNPISNKQNSKYMLELIDNDFNLYPKKAFSMKSLRKAYNSISCPSKAFVTIKNSEVSYEKDESQKDLLENRIISFQWNLQNVLKGKPPINTSLILIYMDEISQLGDKNIPVFGFCRKIENRGILLPDAPEEDLFNTVRLISRVNSWENKISRVYFRGGATGTIFTIDNMMAMPRVQLVNLSDKFPCDIDAKFSSAIALQFASKEDFSYFLKKFPLAPYANQENMIRYRYAIDVDGNTSGWKRSRFILASNTLCIKHKSPFCQWFYPLIKPGVHYLEVERDFSNLKEVFDWAECNPEICKNILQNASKVAEIAFPSDSQKEYLYQAILKYSTEFKISE